jgi:hypothetical protein
MERKFEIFNKAPTLDEYKYLCSLVGLDDNVNFDVAEISLGTFLYSLWKLMFLFNLPFSLRTIGLNLNMWFIYLFNFLISSVKRFNFSSILFC